MRTTPASGGSRFVLKKPYDNTFVQFWLNVSQYFGYICRGTQYTDCRGRTQVVGGLWSELVSGRNCLMVQGWSTPQTLDS